MPLKTRSKIFIMKCLRPLKKEEETVLQRLYLMWLFCWNGSAGEKSGGKWDGKIFNLREQNIDVSNKFMFALIDVSICDEKLGNTTICNQPTEDQSLSGQLL